jgi:dienelactone hydrolase
MAMREQKLGYEFEGKRYEGVLVYDDSVKTKRPAVFMEPDWDGVSAKAVAQAKLIAGTDTVVYVADMFGVGYSPKDQAEKMTASRAVHDDITLSRRRGNKAMDVFLAEGEKLGLMGLVAYHITYPGTTDPAGAAKMKGAVLILHGAEDPVTPRAAIHALEAELDAAKVKWQSVMWSGAVHSFCDPEANAGPTRYDPALAAQSYKLTHEFFARIF